MTRNDLARLYLRGRADLVRRRMDRWEMNNRNAAVLSWALAILIVAVLLTWLGNR